MHAPDFIANAGGAIYDAEQFRKGGFNGDRVDRNVGRIGERVKELATAAQEQAPVTILLVDDGGYGMMRFDQKQLGEASYGVDLHTPRWEDLARAFNIAVDTVDGLDEPLTTAFRDHLGRDEPSMVVARTRLRPPPTTSPRWYRVRSPAPRAAA